MHHIPLSLVSGLRSVDRALVVAELIRSGRSDVIEHAPHRGEDLGTAAFAIAARAGDLVESRDLVIVDLDPFTPPVEFALAMHSALDDRALGGRARLRDVITVASASDIHALLFSTVGACREAEAERLATQLEFATLVVLTGTDTGTDAGTTGTTGSARDLVTRLNPRAFVIPISSLPATVASEWWARPRQAHRLDETLGWVLELAGIRSRQASTNPVRTVVFRDLRPFHPSRFARLVSSVFTSGDVGRILRSRGLVTLASRPGRLGSWATAGRCVSFEPTSMLAGHPGATVGQELVFFGLDLDSDALSERLVGCLLTDAELIAGPTEWANYRDRFPSWQVDHDR